MIRRVLSCRRGSPVRIIRALSFSRSNEYVDLLDGGKSASEKIAKRRLNKSLTSSSGAQELSPAAVGYLNALEEEMLQILQTSLDDNKMLGTFPGLKHLSSVVEIKQIKLNRDFSHAFVYWRIDTLYDFFNHMLKKKTLSAETVEEIKHKIIRDITFRLQEKEPQFRSLIIKNMIFRRVPRIFFRHYDLKTSKELKEQQLQRVIQEEGELLLQMNGGEFPPVIAEAIRKTQNPSLNDNFITPEEDEEETRLLKQASLDRRNNVVIDDDDDNYFRYEDAVRGISVKSNKNKKHLDSLSDEDMDSDIDESDDDDNDSDDDDDEDDDDEEDEEDDDDNEDEKEDEEEDDPIVHRRVDRKIPLSRRSQSSRSRK